MTSEVIVMNKNGLAMAADSAVTLNTSQRIHHYQPKIFALQAPHDIGIMIHERLRLNGIPWETIIKMYQSNLSATSLKTPACYMQDFMNFIENQSHHFQQEPKNSAWIYDCLEYIRMLGIEIEILWHEMDSRGMAETSLRQLAIDTINHKIIQLQSRKAILDTPFERVSAALKIELHTLGWARVSEIFSLFEINNTIRQDLITLLTLLTIKEDFQLGYTGFVIGGFGHDTIFPSVCYMQLGGFYFNQLKRQCGVSHKIDNQNQAQIVPYAASDTISSFIKGIHPHFEDYCLKEFKKCLTRAVLKLHPENANAPHMQCIESDYLHFKEKLTRYIVQHHISPMINSIKFLPCEGLATVAESLVNMTSFRTSVIPDDCLVGGCTRVATIIKGEGFQWTAQKDSSSGHALKKIEPHQMARL